jgi:hypothetical protein
MGHAEMWPERFWNIKVQPLTVAPRTLGKGPLQLTKRGILVLSLQ